jgi:hypothetical protein
MTAYVPSGNRKVIIGIEKRFTLIMNGSIGERDWRVKNFTGS